MGVNRLNGYVDALKKYGVPLQHDLICPCDFVEGKARHYTHQLLHSANRPDAFFAVNDPTAMEALACINESGVRIPDEVALLSFSNAPHSAFFDPPLTVVIQPTFEMGQVGARLLLQQIQEGDNFIPQTNVLHTTMVVRKSTRPGPTGAYASQPA